MKETRWFHKVKSWECSCGFVNRVDRIRCASCDTRNKRPGQMFTPRKARLHTLAKSQ